MSGPKSNTHNEKKDISSAYMIEYAEKENLHIVVPKANELFIDIDTLDALNRFNWNYREMSGLMHDLRFVSFHSAPSRNKEHGQHITITMSRNISVIERIALQAVLGSDLTRELYSVIQYFEGHLLPTVFFEAKPKPPQIIDEEVIDGSESNTQIDVSGGVPGSEQGTCEGVGSSTEEQSVPTDEGVPSQ